MALLVLLELDPFEVIETLEGTNGPVASFQWVIANAIVHYAVLGAMPMHKISREICITTSEEVRRWLNGELIPSEERQKEVIAALAKDLRQRYDDCFALGMRFPSARTRVAKGKDAKKVKLPVVQDVKVETKIDLDAIDDI